jgi:hypothetical protein
LAVSKKILGMIKISAPYQMLGFKILELLVESQSIFSSYRYNLYPISIFGSSNSVSTEEKNPLPSLRHPQIHVLVHDEIGEEEEEKWCLDGKDDDIQDVADINMDDQKIVKE